MTFPVAWSTTPRTSPVVLSTTLVTSPTCPPTPSACPVNPPTAPLTRPGCSDFCSYFLSPPKTPPTRPDMFSIGRTDEHIRLNSHLPQENPRSFDSDATWETWSDFKITIRNLNRHFKVSRSILRENRGYLRSGVTQGRNSEQ